MSLRNHWISSVLLAFVAVGSVAATSLSAETTTSQSNDPTAKISDLIGAEHGAIAELPKGSLAGTKPKKSSAKNVGYSRKWLNNQPNATGNAQFNCLAKALYFEARGESVKGQFAVAEVILNRVDSKRYPNTICSVVNQGTGRKHACQFSFTCDGKADRIREKAAYRNVAKVAKAMIDGAPRNLTSGATHFHTTKVKPRWSRRFPRTAKIGSHLFYRQPS